MKLNPFLTALILAIFVVGACAKSGLGSVRGKLAAKKFDAARVELERIVKEKPDLEKAHIYLLALYRFESSQASQAQQENAIQGMIREFDWLADRYGLPKTYSDMDGAIRTQREARDLYFEARTAVFGTAQ
jgi:hypothetical protein